MQIVAVHLDADRAFDAGRQHVEPVADRRHPHIGDAGKADGLVQLGDQFVHSHARPPLFPWFQTDGGFQHGQRRRVGGAVGAACLAEHAVHFRHGSDQPVGLLQQSGGLARRNAGQGGRHIQKVAFVQRRHEFAAEAGEREQRQHQQRQRNRQRGFGKPQHLP